MVVVLLLSLPVHAAGGHLVGWRLSWLLLLLLLLLLLKLPALVDDILPFTFGGRCRKAVLGVWLSAAVCRVRVRLTLVISVLIFISVGYCILAVKLLVLQRMKSNRKAALPAGLRLRYILLTLRGYRKEPALSTCLALTRGELFCPTTEWKRSNQKPGNRLE